ncbi:MAG TPA: Rieske 2Fe-2S domain-containing protein [Stellaceae bacterium]|nr:Rieske 2Fe-2S domain-containing protein [Stellaceae bacterium]
MLSREENEFLTRVGPGTPCGAMLRRYWWPIALAENLKEAPMPIKLLGEEFVLFRDFEGQLGLLDLHCCHRNASLEFGRVEEGGLRCCYHGWLFDREGRCHDQPCEPPGSTLKTRVRQKAYAVHEQSGLIFGYVGPDPVPAFPKYDLLVKTNCNKVVQGREQLSNWLQRAENMMDALHVMCLHASVYPELAMSYPTTLEYREQPYGCEIYLEYKNGTKDKHHYVFPFINRVFVTRAGREPYQFMQWAVPTDDTHCISYQVWASELEEAPFTLQTAKFQTRELGVYKRIEDGWFNIWDRDQDDAACDSQGAIADRSREHLGQCDKGVVILRRMVKEAIEAVQAGKDPRGVFRDPNHAVIDLWAYKTELGAVAGQIRNPEHGLKVQAASPFDL